MRSISLIFLFCSSLISWGQSVQITPGVLDFGTVDENDLDSLSFTITNGASQSIGIKAAHFPAFFGHEPFSMQDIAGTISSQGNSSHWLRIASLHNIELDQAIIIETDSFYGCYPLYVEASCRYSNSYYSSTYNLDGTALYNALKTRIASPYTDLGYNTARDNMYASIDNVNGQVECVYTGRTATFNTRSGANSNSFNCEHTFPQGFFNSANPMKSDIHHLFPTDVNSNSQRGNLPFGIVTGSPSWQQGGSKKGGGVFEPRDIHKGTVARAMLYFVLRHQDYSNFLSGQETLLRSWHELYPPSTKDIDRNNDIAQLQQNRNPLVDYPYLIDRLGAFSQSGAMSVSDWKIYPDTLQMRYGTSANIVITGIGDGSAQVNLTGSGLQWTETQGTAPYLEGVYEGQLNMISNQSGTEQLNLEVNGVVVDQVYVNYIAGGIGVEEVTLNEFILSPNPANDQVTIEMSRFAKTLEVEIVDVKGQLILRKQMDQGVSLSTEMLESGVYIVRVKADEKWLQPKQLIIQR